MTALCLIPIIMLYAAGNIPAARAAYKQCAPPAAGADFRLRPGRDCRGADFRRGQAEPRARANIPRGEKNPDAWRQLTGVWYASNRSPRITAAKKQELRTILTLKALYLDAPY